MFACGRKINPSFIHATCAVIAISVLTGLNVGGCGPEPASDINGGSSTGLPQDNSAGDPSENSNASSGVVLGETELNTADAIGVSSELLDFGSDFDQLSFHIINRISAAVPFVINTNAPWLVTNFSGGTLGVDGLDVSVRINRGALQPGLNMTVINVAPSGQAGVGIVVRAWGGGLTNGQLATNSRQLDFGNAISTLPLDLMNIGDGGIAFSIRVDDPWATVDVSDGTLEPMASRTIEITVDRGGLSDGDFSTDVVISTGSSADIRVALSVRVGTGGGGLRSDLYVSHSSFEFGTTTVRRSFIIRNQGDGEMPYEVTSSADWMTVENGTGSSSGQYKSVSAVVSRSGLAPGEYNAPLLIHTDRGDASIAVHMTVSDGGGGSNDNNNDGGGNQRGDPQLYVSPTSVSFGSTQTQRTLLVRNSGGGTMNWTAQPQAAWMAISPSTGSSTGNYNTATLSVDRSGLSAGDYSSSLLISGDNGQSVSVAVSMNVPAGGGGSSDVVLNVSSDLLEFRTDLDSIGFNISKSGGSGAINYQITSSQNWLTMSPSSGSLNLETDFIRAYLNRAALVVGSYDAMITISTDAGATASILVTVEKALSDPLIVPWIEVNTWTDDELDYVVDGMQRWNRITDTFIISTGPERASLYTILRERMPNVRVIPGIKTASIFAAHGGGFDNLEAWQTLAEKVRDMADRSGEDVVLLENETALEGWYLGRWDIDWTKFATGLSYLPGDVRIIFYPSTAGRDDGTQARSREICEHVQANLDCEFVDASRAHPGWIGDPDWIQNRNAIDQISSRELLPIEYFGRFGDTLFYTYAQTNDAVRVISETRTVFYPGFSRWTESADGIVPTIEARH